MADEEMMPGNVEGRARQSQNSYETSVTTNYGATTGVVYGNVHNYITSNTREDLLPAYLQKLGPVNPDVERARIMASKGAVLRGSCDWVFHNPGYIAWKNRRQSAALLWLHGDPGKGKTMLMCEIIDRFLSSSNHDEQAPLMASFFCQRQDQRLNSATAVIKGLLFNILNRYPGTVLPLLQSQKDFLNQDYSAQGSFWTLFDVFKNILGNLQGHDFIFVVDALDECPDGQDQLFQLLESGLSSHPNYKWLISSRNEPHIREDILSKNDVLLTSLELNAPQVERAVEQFIKEKVDELKRRKNLNTMMCEALFQHLQKNAEGTFLWVALVAQELRKASTRNMLSKLQEFPAGLQSLYTSMFETMSASSSPEERDNLLEVLRLVMLARTPLNCEDVVHLGTFPALFHSHPEYIKELADECGSFLILRSDCLYPVHQSCVDFFTLYDGCRIWSKGLEAEQLSLGHRCIQLMDSSLHFNFLGIIDPGFEPSLTEDDRGPGQIPSHLAYACRFFSTHLTYQEGSIQEYLTKTCKLFRKHLLPWLEIMSILCISREALLIVNKLRETARNNTTTTTESDAEFVEDSWRFCFYFHSIWAENPLQLYYSCLIFSPSTCLVRKAFLEKRIPSVETVSGLPQNWSILLMSIFPGDSIHELAFSPDGTEIACALWNGTIKLYETNTGALKKTFGIRLPALYHQNWIAWLSDGSKIATVCVDDPYAQINVWDPYTGTLQMKLSTVQHKINSFCASKTEPIFISADRSGAIHFWDLSSEEPFKSIDTSSYVYNPIITPDNLNVIVQARDHVQIWSVDSGQRTHSLGANGSSMRMELSLDGSLLIVLYNVFDDPCAHIYDAASWTEIKTIDLSQPPAYSAVDSIAWLEQMPSKLPKLMVNYVSGQICIYNMETSQCEQTVKNDNTSWSGIITAKRDSPCLSYREREIFVWAVPSKASRARNLPGDDKHQLICAEGSGRLFCVVGSSCSFCRLDRSSYSSDAKQSSESKHNATYLDFTNLDVSGEIEIWSVETSTCLEVIRGVSGNPSCSYTRSLLAYELFGENQVLIRSDRPGSEIMQVLDLNISENWTFGQDRYVEFSSDGRYLKIENDDSFLVWDSETRLQYQLPSSEAMWEFDTVFFQKSPHVLADTPNKSILVWDMEANMMVHELDCDPYKIVKSLKLSDDETKIAVSCFGGSILIFDLIQGAQIGVDELGCYGEFILTNDGKIIPSEGRLSFSGDGRWILRDRKKYIRIPPDYGAPLTGYSPYYIATNSDGYRIVLRVNDCD